jgi:glycerol-3-phosphate acyltransferase PlsX
MRIAIDAMGGDYAPRETVKGAVAAADDGLEIVLVGDRQAIGRELCEIGADACHVELVQADETIPMGEPTRTAVRRRRSSIWIAADLVKRGEAEALISAGNTAAAMAIATVCVGRIPGIDRPAIATVVPTLSGQAVLLDVGANVDCSPANIAQFAVMGTVYAETVLGIKRPRVGLLSIGEEEIKGNILTRSSHSALAERGLNFCGNVEGRDIFSGDFDVVVCDGFVGNVVLKVSEGVAEMTFRAIKQEVSRSLLNRIPMFLLRGALSRLRAKMDYAEYGGAPLLGIRGVCIIAHGRSQARAIANAVRKARQTVEGDVVGKIAGSPLVAGLVGKTNGAQEVL